MKFRFLLLAFLIAPACFGQDYPSDDHTVAIVKQAILKRSSNDPYEALEKFQYESYENFKITGDPEAITGPGYKKTELRKTLNQTKVFFAEKTSTYLFQEPYGLKEQITAANMPGFEEPVYPIYNINFQSSNAYQSPYVIFDGGYINPLSTPGLEAYNYTSSGDSIIDNRDVLKIDFKPLAAKNKATLEGSLFLDKENLAIARVVFTTGGDLNVQAVHNYEYQEDLLLWFNTERFLSIKKEKDKKEFELFGARLEVGLEKENRQKKANEDLYVFLKAVNYNFTNQLLQDYGQRGLITELLDEAIIKTNAYWLPYRNRANNTNDEFASYRSLDSVVVATRVIKKLETLDKFKVGYYPIGFFDVDLKYLIKYNDYEAFRLGIGGTTNEKLFDNIRFGGYIAYGTKDKQFKYNINAGYRLSKQRNTWLNIYHTDDITEFAAESFLTDARVYSLFEPRLINIPTFYLYRDYGISLQQRLFPSVISEISLSRKRVNQTTSYQFQPGNTPFDKYSLAEVKIGARWSPKSSFMRTPDGYEESVKGFPIVSAQITKGFEDALDADFNYLKVSGKISYTKFHANKSKTEFTIEGHYASGEVPLTHLFHAYPNAPNKDALFQRFSVAGRRSFETMFFNEFFSDRLAIGQVKHEFPAFIIAPYLQPELVLISRYAIGNLDDQQQHLNTSFNTLEKGYLESGFELNKLLFGFGLSAAYRYGAYHLPRFEDNLSLKFTFYLEL